MNSQERYWATTHYGDRDRLFHWEMSPYEETILRWREQGLPAGVTWDRYSGYDRFEIAPPNPGLCPGFEYQTLEKTEDYEIYRDGDGVIKKKIKDVVLPAMPQYLEYSLKGAGQWNEFRRQLNPDAPDRFPANWEDLKQVYADRDFPLGIHAGSIYGWLRNWMGIEGVSLALYDNRAFIEQAAEDMTELRLAYLNRALQGVKYDFALFWEDMA
ncbi:MAG: hypothetical protein HY360_09610, partial [Verrucomicrobia bacterium]|nr:hypothetical protein [Verrucomicrobiota bacterium]